MSLLAEYALTPDIFDSTSYSCDEVGDIRLQHLKEVLLVEGLVRDLREGKWHTLFTGNERPWHRRGKELLKKLVQQGRLCRFQAMLSQEPTTDHEWCKEALASHGQSELSGIIATSQVANDFQNTELVAAIDRLSRTSWWTTRSSSVRLTRNIDAYIQHLRPILRCANSLMFLDPHLDPTQTRYHDFIRLLSEMADREVAPLIEAHRVCYFNTRDKRDQLDEAGWKAMFNPWITSLQATGLAVEIFIWDDFHDRYVISDLAGILVPNGFDTTTDPNQITTWSRIGREDRDEHQREFDPSSGRHTLRHRFKLP